MHPENHILAFSSEESASNRKFLDATPDIHAHFFVVDWVKAKLKALRNSYTKAKKLGTSGSARKTLTKRAAWILDKLQFLSPYVATRPSVSNIGKVGLSYK